MEKSNNSIYINEANIIGENPTSFKNLIANGFIFLKKIYQVLNIIIDICLMTNNHVSDSNYINNKNNL